MPLDLRQLYSAPFAFGFEGEALTMTDYMKIMREPGGRVVARTGVAARIVSTVLLGIDHGLGFSEKPIIFETMIFQVQADGGWSAIDEGGDLWQSRYCTKEEAQAGHELTVQALEKKYGEKRKLHAVRQFPKPGEPTVALALPEGLNR